MRGLSKYALFTKYSNIHIQTNGLDVSTIFELNGSKIEGNILNDTQTLIDEKLYGDLLRGFWTK